MGEIGVLNVGAGDIRLIFNKDDPADLIRSARIVKDMLRRGYALLVEVTAADGTKSYTRVHDFDEKTAEYIIADLDPEIAAREDEKGEPISASTPGPARRGRPRKLPATGTKGIAVARSAGG